MSLKHLYRVSNPDSVDEIIVALRPEQPLSDAVELAVENMGADWQDADVEVLAENVDTNLVTDRVFIG